MISACLGNIYPEIGIIQRSLVGPCARMTYRFMITPCFPPKTAVLQFCFLFACFLKGCWCWNTFNKTDLKFKTRQKLLTDHSPKRKPKTAKNTKRCSPSSAMWEMQMRRMCRIITHPQCSKELTSACFSKWGQLGCSRGFSGSADGDVNCWDLGERIG